MANDPQSFSQNRATGRGPVTGFTGPQGFSQNTAIGSNIADVSEEGVGSFLRSANVPAGAEPVPGTFATASSSDENERVDWRVSLSLPEGGAFAKPADPRRGRRQGSELPPPFDPLSPLRDTNNRMVFPYTPNIYITYSANYDNLHPTHSNYPFPVYQNSAVDQFVITGEFTVENAAEGAYWIAANHYLRSVTKMSYGSGPNLGAPPPVVKLNGYGDFVFKDVPVVVLQYTIELGDAVDYIKVPIGQDGSWAPTRSTISVTLQPSYSRDSVNQFSLKRFVEGDYINGDPGFI